MPVESHALQGDVGALLPRLGDASPDDLLHVAGLDARPLDQLDLGDRQQLSGVQTGQPPVALPDGRADGLDDDRIPHQPSSLPTIPMNDTISPG